MLNYYKTINTRLTALEQPEENCWICAVAPTEEEIAFLVQQMGLEEDFVRAALDEEESSRVEAENGQTLIIVDTPFSEQQDEDNTVVYSTVPMGIILAPKQVVTVCLQENPVLSDCLGGKVRDLQTGMRTRFFLTLLLRNATRFLQFLKQIDKISSYTEKQLHRSMRNKELIQLLGLEKSLVFFSTSLKSNEITLEKILRGKFVKMYEEDQDLLEDVIIEVKQAIEMCNIYSGILSGTMDAFASVISNNLNIVMKVLTTITIVMTVPTMVFSFYGMNVTGLPLANSWFPLTLSVALAVTLSLVLVKKGMFH